MISDYGRYAQRQRRSFQMDHSGTRYNRDGHLRYSSINASHSNGPLMEPDCSVPNGPLVGKENHSWIYLIYILLRLQLQRQCRMV